GRSPLLLPSSGARPLPPLRSPRRSRRPARGVGPLARAGAHGQQAGRTDWPLDAPALLRAQLQPRELLLVLRGRRRARAGRRRARHEHPLGREPLLRARRARERRPRQCSARPRELPEGAPRLPADGDGPHLRAARRRAGRARLGAHLLRPRGAARAALLRRHPVAGPARVVSGGAAAPARPLSPPDRRDPRADLLPRAAATAARSDLPSPAERDGGGVSSQEARPAAALRRRTSTPPARPAGRGASLSRRIVLRALSGLRGGELELREGSERIVLGELDPVRPLRATIEVRSPRFYRHLLRGSVGLCESYMDGLWECDDLVAMTRIAALNVSGLDRLRRIFAPVLVPVQRWARFLVRNTPGRARRRIEAHYDLGNELFGLFLDETMMYSCAVFERPEADLREASLAKLERICRRLQLQPEDHVLEIGTGWGGFACYAAERYGCRVTTTTISREQHAYATERVRAAGLSDRVTVLCE